MGQRGASRKWWGASAAVLAAAVGIGCDRGEPSAGAAPQPAAKTAAPPAAAPKPREPRFGSAEPTPKPAGALRFATYNIENLFDDKDDPALSGQNDDADETKPAAHVEAAAAAIRRIDADILALEEVESEEALRAFRDAHLAGMGYEYLASIDAGDERGIEQAVLSRYPIVEVKNWPRLPLGGTHPEKWGNAENFNAGKPLLFHRSPLRVTIRVARGSAAGEGGPAGGSAAGEGGVVGGSAAGESAPAAVPEAEPAAERRATQEPYELTLFVVHQKAGREGDYWRRAEAAKTIELAAELTREDPDRNIIIAGDFNAVFRDAPMEAFRGAGFVDAFDVGRTPGPEYISHASGRRIDFVLLNPAAAKELIPETRFVLGTPTLAEGADYRTTPPPPGYASDHYPVVVDLTPADR